MFRNIIYCITFICGMFGCTNNNSVSKITYQSKVFTEQKLIAYLNQHPELQSSDSVKRVEAIDKFKHEVKVWSNDVDFLEKLPLQATNIRDTIMGNRSFIIATFISYADKSRDKASILNQVQLRVNGIFEFTDQAKGLVLGGKYFLKAMIYKQGKRADINYYRSGENVIYNLGVYPMAIKKLMPVEEKDGVRSI